MPVRQDDVSLLAMRAAKMSTGSIAWALNWTEKRVERRLAELAARAEAAAAPAWAPAEPTPAPAALPAPEPASADAPEPEIADGDGLVTRTFQLAAGGFGAAVLLPDRRLVFAETGRTRAVEGRFVKTVPAEGVYRAAVRA